MKKSKQPTVDLFVKEYVLNGLTNAKQAAIKAGFKCQCCGAKPSKYNNVVLHVDHITPFSDGGTNESENLQVLCSKCNISKSNFYDFNHMEGW